MEERTKDLCSVGVRYFSTIFKSFLLAHACNRAFSRNIAIGIDSDNLISS